MSDAELEAKVARLQKRLAEFEGTDMHRDDLVGQLENARGERDIFRARWREAVKQVESLRAELAIAKAELERLRGVNAVLRDRV